MLANKICPDVLKRAAGKVNIIAVTGTNGKTTTARMLEKALQNAGKNVLANRSGANLLSGITAEFIENLNMWGKPRCTWAVIECDEAACRKVLPMIRPRLLIVTNLFRDQLDRYGDVSSPRDSIAAGLAASPDTLMCLNADSPMALSIGEKCLNKAVFFGFDSGPKLAIESGEEASCPICGKKLMYSFVSYANLGKFSCPNCGFKKPDTHASVSEILDNSALFNVQGRKYVVKSALPGLYNVYNGLGVVAAMNALCFDDEFALSAIESFECGFGRMEEFALGKCGAKMILIKNAAAADQTLKYIKSEKGEKQIVFVINSRIADGQDISWLNDADFGILRRMRGLRQVSVCGERSDDMEKRLEAEGISCTKYGDYDTLIKMLSQQENDIYILPTYTAMLEMRKKLVEALGGKKFWE